MLVATAGCLPNFTPRLGVAAVPSKGASSAA